MHRFDHGLFQLRSREPLTAADHRLQWQLQPRASLVQVQVEDAATFLAAGQRQKKDLVEPSFAQQFGGELLHTVGRRHHEHRRLFLRHPGEHAGQNPLAGPAVTASVPAEALVDLINPQHAGGHGLGPLNGFPGAGFTGADQPREQPAHIQAQQWHRPASGDRLCRERFAGSLGTDQQNTAGCGQPEAARIV